MTTISSYSDFAGNVDEKVKIIGKVSKVMWQHLATFVDTHPHMNYFDLDDGYQILIYTKNKINCEEKIEIIGKLIKVEDTRKNPRSKIHDDYFEYQLVVDSWKCLEKE